MIVVYPVNTIFPSARANTIQILHTAHALSTQGHEVHLIGKKGQNTVEEIFRHYGIPPQSTLNLHLVPAPRLLNTAKGHESLVMKRTVQILSHFRKAPKILFTRDPLFAGLFLNLRGLFRFRLVYEAHTLFFVTAKETYMPVAWNEAKEKRIARREERVLRKADGIVFISRSLKEFVTDYFPLPARSTVIHDGTLWPGELSREKKPNLICYSGQFYLWKGMATLLESMRWVDGAKLLLYGGGYSTVQDDLKEIRRIMDEFQLQDKIEVRSYVPPSGIGETIAECSIGALPLPKNIIANHCNSPLKLFDYMAGGLAVVASDLLTIREIIDHGRNGHLVAPGDPKALADGINLLVQDSGYRNALAAAARDTAKAYTWQERGIHLSRFFEQTVA
jgi:glycosyltransferase involved in cell wall biosynthesis